MKLTLNRAAMFFALLIVLTSIALINAAYGQGDHECQGGHNCNDDGSIIVETVVPGSSSRGYALSGGDMDINDCLATHSILFGLWQGTHINPMCEAARMDRDGDYLGAAEMRCSTRKYRKVYGRGQACIDSVVRTAPVAATAVLVGQVPDTDEDDDARYLEQQQENEYAREERASLIGQIDRLTQQIERAPAARPQIDSGAARRAKSREAYEKALAKGNEPQ